MMQSIWPRTLLFLTLFVTGFSHDLIAQQSVSQADLDALIETINQTRGLIESQRKERNQLQAEILASEQQISSLNTNLDAIRSSIKTETNKLADLKQQQTQLQQEKDSQQDIIAAYIKSAYQAGKQEYLKLLLNQESITGTTRAMEYYRYLNQSRARKIEQYNNTLTRLAEVRKSVTQTTEKLQAENERLTSQQEKLQAQQNERQGLLASLEQQLSSSGKTLEKLEQEKEEMELLINELRMSISGLALGNQDLAFSKLRGRLPWPVQGRLLSRFGSRHALGDLRTEGVTISAAAGTSVMAVHHGRVIFADWFSSSGLLLIIDHGDGYMSLYAHNQQLFKAVGEWVNSGEIIATVGDTGGQFENTLYFEIRHNGESQDPEKWFTASN